MRVALLLVIGLFAGCAATPAPVYTPPASVDGKVCVAHCNSLRAACREAAQFKSEGERLVCEREAVPEYEHCLGRAVNGAARAECVQRSCHSPPGFARCEREHESCYQQCGGRVGRCEGAACP